MKWLHQNKLNEYRLPLLVLLQDMEEELNNEQKEKEKENGARVKCQR